MFDSGSAPGFRPGVPHWTELRFEWQPDDISSFGYDQPSSPPRNPSLTESQTLYMVQDCNWRIKEIEAMTKLRDKALARVLGDLRYENGTLKTEIGMF